MFYMLKFDTNWWQWRNWFRT